jgi:enoyl-CoA hydratase/carnithine racemase
MSEILKFEQDSHGVVVLTMNYAPTRNALTGSGLVDAFLSAFHRIQTEHTARAIIITGTDTVFSSGGSIDEMQRQLRPEFSSGDLRHEYREGIQRLPLALYQLEVPVIAAINGHAIGAGLDLACMCDIRIAAENAKMAESFVKLGIVPGDGGAWFLPRLVGLSRAAELAFTGDTFSAAEALQWGLVSRVVPLDSLLDEARSLARRIAANPPESVRMAKRLMREGQHTRLDTHLELCAAFQAIAHKSPQHAQSVEAFMSTKRARNTTKDKT